ncbi:hypothetical protein [Halioglobus maricola]|uniref:hypothetical protein n=1 Tax=Halioglobus maricola TaxID=2601894 RepID=UPI00197AB049|nr:hypothetical protein [Halioglobus maricola]
MEASRYQRTVSALTMGDEETRGQFASVALFELAEVYMAEADLARGEARESEEAGRLLSWSRAVEQYASQLLLVLEDIELGFPVELRSHEREVPAVEVAGRIVMLAHPRKDQQPAYERAVLSRFCSGHACKQLTQTLSDEAPIPMSAASVAPHWDFSATGPVCSSNGLSLAFHAGGQLAAQRSLCAQLLQEAEVLATELAWQQRHSVNVDWDGLKILPTPQRPQHLVLLNEAGDSLLLTLPLIYGTPGLLQKLSPWLRQRHQAAGAASLALVAAELGWE